MNIIKFETLDSTNTYAKSNIENLADKTVVLTKIQTAGRGRFTRSWVDLGSENIYMTIVLKPNNASPASVQNGAGERPCDAESSSARRENGFSEVYSNLTQYLSIVLCKQLEEIGLKPQIKWPNDVLLNEKKTSGILAETVFRGGSFRGLVLGIGVNLNVSFDDLDKIDRPATAVNIELGKSVDRESFLQGLLGKFFENYDDFLANGFKSIKSEYVKRASFLNQELKVSIFNRIKTGYSKNVDDNGALVLVDENGILEAINMGELL